jgi:predicted transcriptional regulator YdeE
MEFVSLDSFAIVGIEARTSFRREKNPGGVLPALWGRFREEMRAVPNRTDKDTIALYTDYESDEYGEYTVVLGAKVSSAADVPEGMVAKQVPAARYAVFTSERGPAKRVVIDTWKRIWNEPRTERYARSYRNDFELYGAAAADPEDIQLTIYIGVA